jgi:hypothetical protein
VQRCHGAPRTCPSAAFRPGWRPRWPAARRKPARDQPTKELAPERVGLGRADVEANHFPASSLMDGVGDHHALARDAAAVADLLDLGVDGQIRITALQRARAERLDLLVEQPSDPAHLARADPQAEALDQLIDPPCGDTAHVGLLHHRHQRLLGALARLQEAREVAALPELGDLQLDLARAGVPAPRATGDATPPGADQPRPSEMSDRPGAQRRRATTRFPGR